MSTVITVENLGKRYTLHHQQREQYTALRDVITNSVASFGKKLIRPFRSSFNLHPSSLNLPSEDFWALKDVSFEVKQGDRIGIIGRNGAGKSTLLKILSRITEPTTGSVRIKGRVASLLEVGTGFHPELTGRENIFLNGAILGMGRAEIKKKFDEIVDFAEIEKFLDTPVKRYSSGMYVRLAFAVAAHLEPEILIVDEVLAVGDAQFQKKCLGKMEDVGKEGRTVLFVSHQMGAIQRLCSRVIVLGDGGTKLISDTKTAIDFYLGEVETDNNSTDISCLNRSGSGEVKLTSFSLENIKGETVSAAASGESLFFVFGYLCQGNIRHKSVSIGFSMHNLVGDTLVVFYSDYMGVTFDLESKGVVKCHVSNFPFSSGRYYVGARVVVNGVESDWPKGFVGVINVEAGDFYGDGNFGNAGLGPVLLKGQWSSYQN
jgi:lipopolysaccharide transport system ATP-binding protein